MTKKWSSIQQIEPEIWDQFVRNHPYGFHEQTSKYASMRAENNYHFARVGIVSENGELLGGAQLLYRNIFPIGKLAFIPQGPLVSQERIDIAEALIQALDQIALKLGITRLRIINYSNDNFWESVLRNTGFNRSRKKWAPGRTVIVSCNKTEDEILSGMKSNCRYNIRIATQNNLVIRIDEQNDLKNFYTLLENTAQRQKFPIFPLEYYQYIWQLFSQNNNLHLITVSSNEEPLSAIIMHIVGDKAYYLWGAMSPNHSDLMANYMGLWVAIRLARDSGCNYYDLCGGAKPRNDGVAQFKRKWSNKEIDYPDPFDKYYGVLRVIHQRGTQLFWDNTYLRQIVNKIDYRLHKGRMPF